MNILIEYATTLLYVIAIACLTIMALALLGMCIYLIYKLWIVLMDFLTERFKI